MVCLLRLGGEVVETYVREEEIDTTTSANRCCVSESLFRRS